MSRILVHCIAMHVSNTMTFLDVKLQNVSLYQTYLLNNPDSVHIITLIIYIFKYIIKPDYPKSKLTRFDCTLKYIFKKQINNVKYSM